MQTLAPAAPVAAFATASASVAPAASRPTLAEIKTRAKAIKKHRKHEGRRFFHGLCQCLHALGFSF